MANRVPLPSLKKEVIAPYPESSGFAVILVASMAMFFAIASSALALRARITQCPSDLTPAVSSEPVVVEWKWNELDVVEVPSPAPQPCGSPTYRSNADGSVSVFFSVCPGNDGANIPIIPGNTPAYRSDSVDVTVR